MVVNRLSDSIYRSIQETEFADNSAIASQGALETIEALSYLFPRTHPRDNKEGALLDHFGSTGNYSAILEIGAGIGTITRLLLQTFSSQVVAYEVNSFCLTQLTKLKATLPAHQSERLIILNTLSHLQHSAELSAIQRKVEGKDEKKLPIHFFGIIVDGPILNINLKSSISNSPDLKFIFVENWRLKQRYLVSIFLLKFGFRQQYIEVEHENVTTGGLYLVAKMPRAAKKRAIRLLFDFSLAQIKLFPKLIWNVYVSRGKTWKTGRFIEDSRGIIDGSEIGI
jgi:hypothetical protein